MLNSFNIKATETFFIEHKKLLDAEELNKFSKFKNKLKENPYLGDQIRVPFFREFKTNKGKRAYFLIYEEIKIVLFVAVGNKKNQKQMINKIFEKLDKFKEYTYKIYKS